ncbi:MAG TPA: hypothetical protein VFF30_18585 [Nitrososphaerales archaeon]|nr:hypothetical protein [Nitrososphaerales archaeon]
MPAYNFGQVNPLQRETRFQLETTIFQYESLRFIYSPSGLPVIFLCATAAITVAIVAIYGHKNLVRAKKKK